MMSIITENKKAIALMSGGLDSTLAVRIVHDMGIEIMGVHFTGPFCLCNRGKNGLASAEPLAKPGCVSSYAGKAAGEMKIPLKTLTLGPEYLEIVEHPKHGRGSGMNPCLDCRILMFRKAKQIMLETGASFIITGEVLGQRPMSQLRQKLDIIERETGLAGLILRPLSARHLPQTVPETEGWVERKKLMAIQGRSRRGQMDLAKALAIGDYPCPAGGCLLTDKSFAGRLRDHLKWNSLHLSDVELLKLGRHFRLPDRSKLVVGRNQAENEQIERLAAASDILLTPADLKGPSALLRSNPLSPDMLSLAGKITASYCDGAGTVRMNCRGAGESSLTTCERFARDECRQFDV